MTACPGSMITVAAPLARPADQWYRENFGILAFNCSMLVTKLSSENPKIKFIDSFVELGGGVDDVSFWRHDGAYVEIDFR